MINFDHLYNKSPGNFKRTVLFIFVFVCITARDVVHDEPCGRARVTAACAQPPNQPNNGPRRPARLCASRHPDPRGAFVVFCARADPSKACRVIRQANKKYSATNLMQEPNSNTPM